MYNCSHLDDSHPEVRDQHQPCDTYYVPVGLHAYQICSFVNSRCEASETLYCSALPLRRSKHIVVTRESYEAKLHGFWLGQSIANWVGLKTENRFNNPYGVTSFLRSDAWGLEHPRINLLWLGDPPCCTASNDMHNNKILDFVMFRDRWPADDDTNMEYMYQYLLARSPDGVLSAHDIRNGWMHHMRTQNGEAIYLWGSNFQAWLLMNANGLTPPSTGDPAHNPEWELIDAQLTTEIFGLFAPGDPDAALEMAFLPIRTVASGNSAVVAEFYVTMHSLAALWDANSSTLTDHLMWTAHVARGRMPNHTYAAKMYDYVHASYASNARWEKVRLSLHYRYMVDKSDGFDYYNGKRRLRKNTNAGINFACSLVSLFWGQGDFKETVKIATLCGWDSDNPAATWGGLLGFYLNHTGIRMQFPSHSMADTYFIEHTRRNFPYSTDTFARMSQEGCDIVEKVFSRKRSGFASRGVWYINATSFRSL